ncbi:MAG TPA: cupredoxin family copper-binding protein [Solirubrobacteraceae bacterium]|jgi:LPXTG-motif cell wall-anchored protein|nr:cupredoxin family copper-binding protein [Solirubrobacteraceae bacterium]
MRVLSGRLIMVAACCAAIAAVPVSVAQATSTGAALSTSVSSGRAAKTPAAVHVIASPARPAAGQHVRLAIAAPPAGAADFAWDLAGHGAFTRRTGHSAETDASFQTPGIHSVAVRFTAGGQVRLAVLTVTVAPGPAPQAELSGRVTAHAAGDPGVTIADFHFSPAATTIHVGDTITWSNSGPSSHTATASNGSFNTGVLKKGQSASHTFTQPGTFAYVCQIHPFMHGTITVLASTTSTTPSPATATPTTTTPTPTTAAATQTPPGPTLPNTGFNVLAGLFAGIALLGLGAALRRTRVR